MLLLFSPNAIWKRLYPRRIWKASHIVPVSILITPLVGRECELQALRDMLQSEVRLVTLTGTGGIGKTHRALSLGNEVREAFAQGAVFRLLSTISLIRSWSSDNHAGAWTAGEGRSNSTNTSKHTCAISSFTHA